MFVWTVDHTSHANKCSSGLPVCVYTIMLMWSNVVYNTILSRWCSVIPEWALRRQLLITTRYSWKQRRLRKQRNLMSGPYQHLTPVPRKRVSPLEKFHKLTLTFYQTMSLSLFCVRVVVPARTLSYWCFSPGYAMTDLTAQGVRSIVLTSGTLSPLDSFSSELHMWATLYCTHHTLCVTCIQYQWYCRGGGFQALRLL